QPAHKPQCVVYFPLGLIRVSEDKGKFRNDAVLARARRGLQSLLRGDSLLHLAQDLVAARFRSKEDHRKARAFQPLPGFLGKPQDGIDARLAPPSEIEGREMVRRFPRMGIMEEKIVVVEMHGVHAVLAGEKTQMVGGPCRILYFLRAAEDGDDAAEI